MVLAASESDQMVVTEDHLGLASTMISDLEKDMPKVFSRIGRSEDSVQAERFINFIHKNSPVDYMAAYGYIHSSFPYVKDFEGIVAGAVKAGLIKQQGLMFYKA
jgi:hypothetical protein